MPPGPPVILPKINVKKKRVIRPSSAAANLQTHPAFTTGLFDTYTRPSTATTQLGDGLLPGQRPHTQAGGARRQWQFKAKEHPRPDDNIVKHPRRLTLGAVDGIAESESIVRPGNIHGNVSQQLKSKVRTIVSHV